MIIKANGLKKTFKSRRGPVEAVRGVDIEVGDNEIVGLLGPNGAGKTTTLRMLTTLLSPSEGNADIAGHDLNTDPKGVRSSIGYVSQSGGAAGEALVAEEIEYHARFYGLVKRKARARTEELLPLLDLGGLERRPVKTLSGGQERRLHIALGLVHQPPLVFLDEPTTGLDPQSRNNMWEHIRRLRRDLGTTIVLTTHYLEEADALCDRIYIIDDGEIVAEGTPGELKSRVNGDLVTIGVPDGAERARQIASAQPGAGEVEAEDAVVRLRVPDGDKAVVTLLRDLDRESIKLDSLSVTRPTLDDVFLTLTGRTLRE